MNYILTWLLLPTLLFVSAACQRSEVDREMSKLTIQTPTADLGSKKLSAMGVDLPTDKRVCYGINVFSNDIATTRQSSCHSPLSLTAGFVSEGEALSLMVPKGSDRNFELYVYLTDLGANCPSWSEAFQQVPSNYLKVYKSGITQGITLSKEEETVVINLDFPGVENHVAGQNNETRCLGGVTNAKLRAVLYSNRNLIHIPTSSTTPVTFSKAYWDSFFELDPGATFYEASVGYATTSASLYYGESMAQSLPYLRSFTRKIDTGEIFAMSDSGRIYKVGTNGSASASFVCPFQSCQLPPWVQSISAGFDTQLYALDHAGNIYAVTVLGLVRTGVEVSAAVTHIAFY